MSKRSAEPMVRAHLWIGVRDLERLDTFFGTVNRSEAVRNILRLYLNRIEAKAAERATAIKVEDINLD